MVGVDCTRFRHLFDSIWLRQLILRSRGLRGPEVGLPQLELRHGRCVRRPEGGTGFECDESRPQKLPCEWRKTNSVSRLGRSGDLAAQLDRLLRQCARVSRQVSGCETSRLPAARRSSIVCSWFRAWATAAAVWERTALVTARQRKRTPIMTLSAHWTGGWRQALHRIRSSRPGL